MKKASPPSEDVVWRETTFEFDPETIRSAETPPEDSARLFWIFLSLIRRRTVDYTGYVREFQRGHKTFARDLAKLREIGHRFGFSLTRQRRGKASLISLSDVLDPLRTTEAIAADTLRAVADALGEFVAADIRAHVSLANAPSDPFLRIALPQIEAQTAVARFYGTLRTAWSKHQRVRFRYPAGDADPRPKRIEERVVEPHLVTYYEGRYYLVAFDPRPRTQAWRQFALDRIEGTITPAGTFTPRIVPIQYRGDDAIGLFKTGKAIDVVVAIAPTIAASVLGRRWQKNQRRGAHANGWPIVTFELYDIGEAVRWAFGFGTFARVVAPAAAVAMAKTMADQLAATYQQAMSQPEFSSDIARDTA